MQDLQVDSLLVRFVRKYEGPTTERTSMLKIIRLFRRQLLLALRCEEAASGPPFLDWTIGMVADWLKTHYYLILLVNLNMFRAGWHVVVRISIAKMKTQQLVCQGKDGDNAAISIQWDRVPAKVNKKHMTTHNDFPFTQQGKFKHRDTMRKVQIQSRINHLKSEQNSHIFHFWVYNSPFYLHVNGHRNPASWKKKISS